jgi:gas vesicle protein
MQQRIANIAQLPTIAQLQGERLAHAVRQQSRPRRWPWQPKTLYDLAHERSAEVAGLAAERAAALAAAAAQERDRIAGLVREQSRPRRRPWQPKTARDLVDERSARIAANAAALSAQLAELTARRRDSLLDQVRKQSRPRRWPWQPKTARDRLNERGAALRAAAGEVTGQVAGTLGTARETLGAARETLRSTAVGVPHTIGATAGAAAHTLHEAADVARQRVSETRDTAAHTLHEAAEAARHRVSDTTGAVSGAISSRVDATTGAINESIAAGQRRVRRGVRLARWSFWSFVAGVATGVLVAPRSGEETRRELQAAAQHVGDALFPPKRG